MKIPRWPVLLLSTGCLELLPWVSKDDVATPNATPDGAGAAGADSICSQHANLEVVPLDVWGMDLDDPDLDLSGAPEEIFVRGAGPGVVLYPLDDEQRSVTVQIAATDFTTTEIEISYDGTVGTSAFDWTNPTGEARLATSHENRQVNDTVCPVTTVYIGMDHAFFAATGRAPSDNDVDLLMDGEEFWEAVHDDLWTTRRRVSWMTWWWESDFEMVRPSDHVWMSESSRYQYTAMSVMDALDHADRRVLINRFWDDNSDFNQYLNTDAALRDRASTSGDGFEVILQGNPTDVPITGEYSGTAADFDFGTRVLQNPRYAKRPILTRAQTGWDDALEVASYHQKAIVIDGEIALVTGMNTKAVDWDTVDHEIFDERRMYFDSSTSEREDVFYREEFSDFGPRKDYGIRVEGPAAHDVEELMVLRWDQALDEGDLYADRATAWSLDDPLGEIRTGVPTQVTATMPAPFAEMSILETHGKAFMKANRYIFIEDQYFRAPLMNEMITERMLDDPDLLLIVVSQDISPWDGGAKYTYLSDHQFRTLFPDRYLLLQIRSVDLVRYAGWWGDYVEFYVEDINNHSKLRLVDDRYLSVGSCNMNNRGYLYEGELNVSVLDKETATAARERVFENLVGADWAPYLSDDAKNNFDVLQMAAEYNQELLDWWEYWAPDLDADEAEDLWEEYEPSGMVYPLEISSDYYFEVGPDLF